MEHLKLFWQRVNIVSGMSISMITRADYCSPRSSRPQSRRTCGPSSFSCTLSMVRDRLCIDSPTTAELNLRLDEPDNAALAMMERLADWDHDQFKKVAVKVANMEIAYKAVSFYLAHQVSGSAWFGRNKQS